jgi:hypothetical protein
MCVMMIRAFTILSLAMLAIGFIGACYSGVDQPDTQVIEAPIQAALITTG